MIEGQVVVTCCLERCTSLGIDLFFFLYALSTNLENIVPTVMLPEIASPLNSNFRNVKGCSFIRSLASCSPFGEQQPRTAIAAHGALAPHAQAAQPKASLAEELDAFGPCSQALSSTLTF